MRESIRNLTKTISRSINLSEYFNGDSSFFRPFSIYRTKQYTKLQFTDTAKKFCIIRSLVFIPHENKFVIFCWCEVFFGYYFLSLLEKCHGKLPKIPGKYQMKTLVRLNKSLFLSCVLRKKPRRKRNQTVLNM